MSDSDTPAPDETLADPSPPAGRPIGVLKYNDRDTAKKNAPLTEADVAACQPLPEALALIGRVSQAGTRQGLRVLDYGCGKGASVAALRALGVDAYGLDIVPLYIENGRRFFRERGQDPDVLALLDSRSRSDLPEASFDVVLSNQVLEHVANLDDVVAELARLCRPGAEMLHVFPARWRPVEVHLKMPFVQWLPKNAARRWLIGLCIRLGIGVRHFPDLSVAERTRIYNEYSVENTYYRPRREIEACFARHGFACDVESASAEKLAGKLGAPGRTLLAVPVLRSLLTRLHTSFASMHIHARRL